MTAPSEKTDDVKQAFNNLLDAISAKVEQGFTWLEKKLDDLQTAAKDKRLEQLRQDLEELENRKETE